MNAEIKTHHEINEVCHLSKKKQIAVICGDAGGTNAIIPVIDLLLNEANIHLDIFSYREGRKILKKKGLYFTELNETINFNEIIEILQELKIDLLFSDTSLNSLAQTSLELEKLFILAAHKLRIPSLAVLDYWSNYTIRFSDNKKNLIYLPDKIAIMDNLAYNEMILEKFPSESLVITGQPAFSELINWTEKFNDSRKRQILTSLGVYLDEYVVIFASEPILSGNPLHTQYPRYSEESVLELLISALEKIQLEIIRRIVLVIRPHPKENHTKFQRFVSKTIRIIISIEEHTRDIVMSADLVTGITSTILIEAAMLGCIVVSLQPGLLIKDILPTNNTGLTQPIYKEEEMPIILKSLLIDPTIRKKVLNSRIGINNENAACKVLDLINSMLNQKFYRGGYMNETQ